MNKKAIALPPFDALPQYLIVEQAAAFTRHTKRGIYSLVSKGELPFRKPGGKLLFDKYELRDWINGDWKPKETAEEVKPKPKRKSKLAIV